MLVTAKKDEQTETVLPTRATYYAANEEEEEADPKVINYDELLDLNRPKSSSSDVSFESLNPDLLPTDTTLRVLRGEPFVKEENKSMIRSRHRTKGKAMIAVYAAAIVALLLVVILNAIALMKLSVSTASLEMQVQAVREQTAERSAVADSLADLDRVIEEAKKLGYTFAE